MNPPVDGDGQQSTVQDRTCRFITLGCKANQYDTQRVREAMFQAGFREATGGEAAQVCVVNTCTVTGKADADGRYEIRKLQRQNPGARIVVMGCYAARAPMELRRMPGGLDVVDAPHRLPEVLASIGVEKLPDGISRFAGHHRAFVKVQDGCMLDCTFCIIPKVRPQLQSRPAEAIEAEVKRLVAAGFREVVLAGIHLGHYGLDPGSGRPSGRFRLSHLVRRLASVPGVFRIRLSSLDAAEVTEDLIDVVATEPRVCPHLHICLQSGSDAILAAMRRRYRVAGFLKRIDWIRARLDHPALTSDVIVGFPGESEGDFEKTLAVCQAAGFSKIHIFPFSARAGTPAASMTGPVDQGTIRVRKSRLQVLANQLEARYYQSVVGQTLEVLVERIGDGASRSAEGTACRYIPVRFHARPGDEYQLVNVQVTEAHDREVVGHLIEMREGANERFMSTHHCD